MYNVNLLIVKDQLFLVLQPIASIFVLAVIFMSLCYLQFNLTKNKGANSPLKKVFQKVMNDNILLTYPAFNEQNQRVSFWLIEFDCATGIPNREVLYDQSGKFIARLKNRKVGNGWALNNLLVTDFKASFDQSDVSKEWFEEQWSAFERVTYNFKVEVSDYRFIYNYDDKDDIDYSCIETTIVYKGRKRKVNIFYGDGKFDPYPIRGLEIIGQLYDADSRSTLSLHNVHITEKNYS